MVYSLLLWRALYCLKRNLCRGEVLVRMTEPDGYHERDYTACHDLELVAWAKEDRAAFGELYSRYVKRIYSYVYYRTGNHHDAEDLTSRVFFKALAHIDRYKDRGVPFSAWLYRIAHNQVANWHRDRGRQRVVPLDDHLTLGHGADAPEFIAENSEQEARLLASIRQLPPDRQQLLILKFVERMSNAEIGAVMNRTEGAIKSLYHRTLLSLRGLLDEDERAPDSPG